MHQETRGRREQSRRVRRWTGAWGRARRAGARCEQFDALLGIGPVTTELSLSPTSLGRLARGRERPARQRISDVQGGPVDELLDVAVERPALDQLEVEVGRTVEDRVQPGLTGDHRE